MESDNDFDFEAYRQNLLDTVLDTFPHYYERGSYDAHDALSEAVFEVADQCVAHDSVSKSLAILQQSPNEPQEYEPFIEGKDGWREINRGLAFTVVRHDIYDVLEEEGYLDEYWTPTEQLTEIEAAV